MSEVTGELSGRRRTAERWPYRVRGVAGHGGSGPGAALADGRWWHHFAGQGAPGADQDQLPVTGADPKDPASCSSGMPRTSALCSP
jgi:hypothetical protein